MFILRSLIIALRVAWPFALAGFCEMAFLINIHLWSELFLITVVCINGLIFVF